MNQPIYLWGYMGAGKSRLGKRLASILDRTFYDLDQVIEQRASQSIPMIFAQLGEAQFRQLEKDTLETLSKENNVLISTGGGTPCNNTLDQWMLDNGLVIFLDVDNEELFRRLWKNKASRPLIAAMSSEEELRAFIANHYAQRKPIYERAQIHYDNSNPKSDLSPLIEQINTYFTN